jgi:hypothetical protein
VAALEVLAIGLDPPHAKRKRADNGSIIQATSLSSTPTKEYERATKKVKTSDNKIQTVTNSDGILSNVVHADGASNDKNDANDDSEDNAEDGELPTVHPGDNESNSEEIPSIQTGDEEEGELFVMQDYCDRDVKIEVDDGQIAVEQDMDVSNQQGSDDEKSELSNKHENRDEKVSGDCDNEEDGELCNTQATEEEGEL